MDTEDVAIEREDERMDINRGSESAAWFLVPWSHLSDTFQPQHHSLKFDPSLVINDSHMTCLHHSFS